MTDDELAALALAADSTDAVSAEAVSVWEFLGAETNGPLPSWYMPAPMGAPRLHGWYGRLVRCSVFSIIASLGANNAYGLCNTYGQLDL